MQAPIMNDYTSIEAYNADVQRYLASVTAGYTPILTNQPYTPPSATTSPAADDSTVHGDVHNKEG